METYRITRIKGHATEEHIQSGGRQNPEETVNMAEKGAKQGEAVTEKVHRCEQDKGKIQQLQKMAVRILEQRNTLDN